MENGDSLVSESGDLWNPTVFLLVKVNTGDGLGECVLECSLAVSRVKVGESGPRNNGCAKPGCASKFRKGVAGLLSFCLCLEEIVLLTQQLQNKQ